MKAPLVPYGLWCCSPPDSRVSRPRYLTLNRRWGGGGRGEERGKGIREGREEAVRGGVGGDGVCRVVGKGGERACVFVHNVQTNKEGMKDGPSSR